MNQHPFGSLTRLDMEGSTLTYYGMIDGNGSPANAHTVEADNGHASQLSTDPPSYDTVECVPPPSYADAATGKYSPRPNS